MRLISLILITLSFIFTGIGCSGHPKGMNEIRALTGREKADIIQTVMKSDEIKLALEEREYCQIRISWVLVKWHDDNGSIGLSRFDYNFETDPGARETFEAALATGANLFVMARVEAGDPIDIGIDVAINPISMEIAYVSSPHGIKPPLK